MVDEKILKTKDDHLTYYDTLFLIIHTKNHLFQFHWPLVKHVQSNLNTTKWIKLLFQSKYFTFPSSFSTANQRWEIKWNFSIVCKSRTITYFKNHDADESRPELSCQMRIQCKNPNGLKYKLFSFLNNSAESFTLERP